MKRHWVSWVMTVLIVLVTACNVEKEEIEPVFQEEKPPVKDEVSEEEQTAHLEADEDGVLKNPSDIEVLVNREYRLPADYEPEDLVVPDVAFPYEEDVPKKQLRKPAAEALEALFREANEEGLTLFAVSGYRSYTRQETIFAANVSKDGEEAANQYSARPGESEHQTGLAMDVSSPSNNYELTIEFGKTAEGEWLKDHAHHHGFIIRYPEDKTDITGYQYEPWHLRYVGEELATHLYETEKTLEEYYGAIPKD